MGEWSVHLTNYPKLQFDFIIKTPPAAVLLMEAAKKKKGSPEPNRQKVASVNWDQVRSIAEIKMPDLNAYDMDSAVQIIAGSARSMGIETEG